MASTTAGTIAVSHPASEAYQVLRLGYVLLPLVAGLDKFIYFLTDWQQYLSPLAARVTGVEPRMLLYAVGVVEVGAAVLVAIKPRLGGYVVALWLWAIILNLLLIPDFYDIALRDFGLSIGALALARLGRDFEYRAV